MAETLNLKRGTGKLTICGVTCVRSYLAWFDDEPDLKYEGRTRAEAVGKLILSRDVPRAYNAEIYGADGKRILGGYPAAALSGVAPEVMRMSAEAARRSGLEI